MQNSRQWGHDMTNPTMARWQTAHEPRSMGSVGRVPLIGLVLMVLLAATVLSMYPLGSLMYPDPSCDCSTKVATSSQTSDSGSVSDETPFSIEDNEKPSSIVDIITCSLYGKKRNEMYFGNCEGCTSQRNQDEILRRIFDTIGTTNRRCVEFGFGYHSQKGNDLLTLEDFKAGAKIHTGLNTQALIADGWTPAFFDAEISNQKINLIKNVLTAENIGSAFKDAEIPLDVDYVSIDVDSVDVWLFHGMLSSGYRPRVVSVEYNQNFPIHMMLACEKKWAPWKKLSRIFGSSASAINLVAEMFGYQAVEIMPELDIFFVRKNILESKCTPESLPNFETLAKGFVGKPGHVTCSSDEVQRLVDFPLAMLGLENEAKEKAVNNVHELNDFFMNKWNQTFCKLG